MDLNQHHLIQTYIQNNRFGILLGMQFSILAPGIVEYRLEIGNEHLATPFAAHGGVISSLLDATLGVGALSAVCEDEQVVSTVEMKVSFFRPAIEGDSLIAHSNILQKGKRILFMEAIIHNQNKEFVAKATGTLNCYPKEKAGY
jgi:uncharacterized protein (TIGR00369 family)